MTNRLRIQTWTARHPRHAAVLAILGVLVLWGIRWHPGYDWGPYRVRPGDTLSGILVRAINDEWVAFAMINGLREQGLPVDVIWANVRGGSNGDRVRILGNELIIMKPNGTALLRPLVTNEAYAKRRFQVFGYNAVVVLLGVLALLAVAAHARGHDLAPLVRARWVRWVAIVPFWLATAATMIITGLVSLRFSQWTAYAWWRDYGGGYEPPTWWLGFAAALALLLSYLVLLIARGAVHLVRTRLHEGWLWAFNAASIGVVVSLILEVLQWKVRLSWF